MTTSLPKELQAGNKPLDKYFFLRRLQVENPPAFYRLLLSHAEELLPYIYTPTVGQACQERHLLLQHGLHEVGLTLRLDRDRGCVLQRLREWPLQQVDVVVVTDGERILGLGDLGANGAGISEGKIALYTVAAGISPSVCLPLCLDVGTNNAALRDHPAYGGMRAPRPRPAEYHAFVAEVMAALRAWRPHVLLQFEDFHNHNAFELLDRYRGTHCCFNDDIQGTAAVVLAAVLAALRLTGGKLADQVILFQGAGEAAAGIASLIAGCIAARTGLPLPAARRRCFLVDTKGLVCAARGAELQAHKRDWAHDVPHQASLLAAVRTLRPTVLIGAAATPGAFTQEVLDAMRAHCRLPVVMPLSNPTSMSECTFQQAMEWTQGQVVFASGSPFSPLAHPITGTTIYPAQANNSYIFPAVGHAAVLCKARTISDTVFMAAAEELSRLSSLEELRQGKLFPDFSRVRECSAAVMAACARVMVQGGGGHVPLAWRDTPPAQWHACALASMWGADEAALAEGTRTAGVASAPGGSAGCTSAPDSRPAAACAVHARACGQAAGSSTGGSLPHSHRRSHSCSHRHGQGLDGAPGAVAPGAVARVQAGGPSEGADATARRTLSGDSGGAEGGSRGGRRTVAAAAPAAAVSIVASRL